MKLGIDASCLCTDRPTGVARYGSNLLKGLSTIESNISEINAYYSASRFKKRDLIPEFENISNKFYYKNYLPIRKNVDLIHGLDMRAPSWNQVKRVVTIHDLFLLIDTSEEVSTDSFRNKMIKKLRSTVSSLNGIIAVSESTKSDIVKILDVDPNKIYVTHLGINDDIEFSSDRDVELVKKKYNLGKNYLFFIGSISGRKNTEKMVRAFKKSGLDTDYDFVLAGGLSHNGEKTVNAIDELGLKSSVKILSYVDDQDISALYTGSSAFVFPTLYEGFGLPILEAMACKTPVLIGNRGSSVEIASGLAEVVNPLSIESIAEGLINITKNNKIDIEAAYSHAKSFTWQRCAKSTYDAYCKILQEK